MAHQLIAGVLQLLDRAKSDGGHCFAALYELADPELVTRLGDPAHLSLILSNAGEGAGDETNAAARADLHGGGVDITDRMLAVGTSVTTSSSSTAIRPAPRRRC